MSVNIGSIGTVSSQILNSVLLTLVSFIHRKSNFDVVGHVSHVSFNKILALSAFMRALFILFSW